MFQSCHQFLIPLQGSIEFLSIWPLTKISNQSYKQTEKGEISGSVGLSRDARSHWYLKGHPLISLLCKQLLSWPKGTKGFELRLGAKKVERGRRCIGPVGSKAAKGCRRYVWSIYGTEWEPWKPLRGGSDEGRRRQSSPIFLCFPKSAKLLPYYPKGIKCLRKPRKHFISMWLVSKSKWLKFHSQSPNRRWCFSQPTPLVLHRGGDFYLFVVVFLSQRTSCTRGLSI